MESDCHEVVAFFVILHEISTKKLLSSFCHPDEGRIS